MDVFYNFHYNFRRRKRSKWANCSEFKKCHVINNDFVFVICPHCIRHRHEKNRISNLLSRSWLVISIPILNNFIISDASLCNISDSNQLIFNSESIPIPCHYTFKTQHFNSYIAVLVQKCEGLNPATIQYNNSTVILPPSSFKKLMVIPASSLDVHVDTTWPGSETKLEIQFFELKPGSESVDVFLIDSDLEIEWISKSTETCMEGEFRTLTVNMIMTSSSNSAAEHFESTWNVQGFRKSCSEDNVQVNFLLLLGLYLET